MTGVIVAAVVVRTPVSGERVAGLTLLERARRTALRAGFPKVDVADAAPDRAGVLAIPADRVFDPALVRRLLIEDRPTDCYLDGRPTGLAVTGPGPRRLDLRPEDARPADTPAARAAAEAALFAALRKPVDGFVSRHLNRHLSLAVTRLLLPTPITPNQMTVIAALIGLAGVWLVFRASFAAVAAGALLVQLQSVLDGCDGEIARLKLQSSRFGEWFDNVTDDLVNASYGFGLGYASAILFAQPLWLWLGTGATCAFIIYDGVVYTQLAIRHGATGNPFAFRWWYQRHAEPIAARVRGAAAVVHALVRRDTFLLAFLFLCLARLPQVAVLWYAIVSSGYLLMTIVHLGRGGMRKP